MSGYTRNVLVVEPDPVERERLAAALEGERFRVLECAGPSAPDYTCVGVRSGRCPLAADDCVVVLDVGLVSDAPASRRSAEDVLRFYLEGRHRVVTLGAQPIGCESDRILPLRRHPETDVLVAAVWWSAAPPTRGIRPLVRGDVRSS
jgi:CheY-like chemotaxis protein